jgi:RHS repeat-associated protein
MLNTSGISSISLPKGGGALQGLGEKFSADLHTGTATFSVPIQVPEGRKGFQPNLQLDYSSGQGNGPFGLGWALSIPAIGRKTSKGVPRYELADIFVLSGAEDLVATSIDTETRRYRPRTETLFADIVHYRDPARADDYWRVYSKDGLINTYGTPASAGFDAAVIAHPVARSQVFTWKLTRTRDPFGNVIEYDYLRDSGPENDWDQLYIRQIRYVDHQREDGERAFLITVDFIYEMRADAFSDYRSGFQIRTMRRCRSILVQTHAPSARSVRRYDFEYQSDAHSSISLLSKIHAVGFDDSGAPSTELPPLSFDYTRFEPDRRRLRPLSGQSLPARSLADPDMALVDLFGDGLPDILEMNGSARYWRNRGGGTFDTPRPMRDAPGGFALADAGVQLLDADGDGRIDLLVKRPGLAGYFPLRHDGLWDKRSFQPYRLAPSFNFEDPDVRLMDLDGDGVTDALRSGVRFECFFNDPRRGWHDSRTVERKPAEHFPDVVFSDPRVQIADMSGDGLQDIVLVSDGNVEYWPNLGHGDWGRRVSMKNAPQRPHLPYRYDPHRLLLGDINGDGAADLVYVDDGVVTLWINQCGNGWSDPIRILGTPTVSGADVLLADILGTGTPGVLWTSDASQTGQSAFWFLDVTGDAKPYLLSSMDNHLGAVTRVRYAASIRYSTADHRNPATRWRTPLPFPAQVVAQVEVIDTISGGKLTTEYRYRHGYWDGAEREFRGFGLVESYDTETFHAYHGAGERDRAAAFQPVEKAFFSPPTCLKTWFHQGPVGDEFGEWSELDYTSEYWAGDAQLLGHADGINAFLAGFPQSPTSRRIKRDALRALRGSVLRSELYVLDGSDRETRPHVVNEYAYGLREEASPAAALDRQRIFFLHSLATRNTQWDRGDDPLTQFIFTSDYDSFGQSRQRTAVTMPRRSQMRRTVAAAGVGEVRPDETRVLATHNRTAYATPDPGAYLQDRVAEARQYELRSPPALLESAPGDLAAILRDQAKTAADIRALFDQLDAGLVRLAGHAMHYYDGEAFAGLPMGRAGRFGALSRSETLAFTDAELDAAYGAARPAYLDGHAPLPAGAPPGFAASMGYRSVEDADGRRYYAPSTRLRFDFQSGGPARGLALASRDPFGNESRVTYDAYGLLPVAALNPAGLATQAEYDYRVLRPARIIDPNGNVSEFHFSPTGLLKESWVKGKPGQTEGDRQHPSVTYSFDFTAAAHGRPINVHTVSRVHHDTAANATDETIEIREYSDGFGRLIQTRVQAEDLIFGPGGDEVGLPSEAGAPTTPAAGLLSTDRVTVSGWQVFDNKGRVVKRFEPFFAAGWAFEGNAAHGRSATLLYDPLGRLLRTVNADGSEQRVVPGIPGDLARPDICEPTPWESYAYDANDLAPLSRELGGASLANRAPAAHHFTPSSTIIDGLGRILCHVERNGRSPQEDWILTRSSYDSRGNLLTVADTLGRMAFRHTYDLANRRLETDSIDAGRRITVFNAAGQVAESRDAKGGAALIEYDRLGRVARLWARDEGDQPVSLRERIDYGDGGRPDQPPGERDANRVLNRLGRPARHYDEAGRVEFERYDFSGNLVAKARRVIADAVLAAGWTADWRIAVPDDVLDAVSYRTDSRFDALGRVNEIILPASVTGERARLVPRYNRAGALDAVRLDGEDYVKRIAYNARGQRVLIAYGNALMTRHCYDPSTFRLRRLRSERYTTADDRTYTPAGGVLQDCGYEDDVAGNITAIRDRAPQSGIAGSVLGSDALDRLFAYDPLYRLSSSTGRECDAPPEGDPWNDLPRCTDLTRTRRYEESYAYDIAGNISQIRHTHFQANGAAIGRLRTFRVASDSNRLLRAESAALSYPYVYDRNGNITQEATSRHFVWDHADRLKTYRTQASAGPASVTARYLYDSAGQRVKKLVSKGATLRATVYIEGVFEHHSSGSAGNNAIHVMDGDGRIAIRRIGPPLPGEVAQNRVEYHLGDHLGSSNIVVAGASAVSRDFVNREEMTPFGETSFGSFARKRYRFSGKERDEESGLYYFGARYYAPWLGRWASCDPAGPVDGNNLYRYAGNNPLAWKDPTGMQQMSVNDSSGGPKPETSNVPAAADTGGKPGGHHLEAEHPQKFRDPESAPDASNIQVSPKQAPADAFKNMGGPKVEKSTADVVAEKVQAGTLHILNLHNPLSHVDRATNGAVTGAMHDIMKSAGFSETDINSLNLYMAMEGQGGMQALGEARQGISAAYAAPKLSLNRNGGHSGTSVANPGKSHETRPAEFVREVSRSEKFLDLTRELMARTNVDAENFANNNEHAIVSLRSGNHYERFMVRGGPGGIDMKSLIQLSKMFNFRMRIIVHTHPQGAPRNTIANTPKPSPDDRAVLNTTGQRSSFILERPGGPFFHFWR